MQKYISFMKYFGPCTQFSSLVQSAFCTTTYLNISLKLLPKLREVSRSILFHFVQKPIYVLWKYWVNQPHFHSGPTWWFVQQPYFCMLFNPWPIHLLVDHHAKPLRPGACTFWIIFGSWNNVIYSCPELKFCKTCINKFLLLSN